MGAEIQRAIQPSLDAAAAAYMAGDYETAFAQLSSIPDLLGVVPIFDRLESRERARILFDLGRIRLAAGDTARAKIVLAHVFMLDPLTDQGLLRLPPDRALVETRAFLARLHKRELNLKLRSASKWGGAFRSLAVPGWGQLYRGHKRRGYAFMGVSAGLLAFWVFSDQSYRSAYRAYRNTRFEDLSLDSRTGTDSDPFPYRDRFDRAQSRARRANFALGILAAVWISNVLDNLVVGPAQVAVVVPIR